MRAATVLCVNDAQLLEQFLVREQRWLRTLQELRTFHEAEMAKVTTSIRWLAGGELGRLSWLGFYWHHEMFWFGYGLHEGIWRPLIEVDNRSKCSDVLTNMQAQLCGVWASVAAERNLFRRLWAPPTCAGTTDVEFDWFRARSRELHEYLVLPEA